MNHPTRRHFLRVSTALTAGIFAHSLAAQEQKIPPANAGKAPPKPPGVLPPDKVQAVVGQSHRSLDAVKALVEDLPNLVNACWDWGAGDFETPLQAAAHTGQREIAEYLLSKNARFDIYAAAMLGQLDVVKSYLAADVAKLAAVPGPHGFSLLHCAKQGGDKAKAVADYLMSVSAPSGRLDLPYKWPEGTAPKTSQ
jgi:hypothetical protein